MLAILLKTVRRRSTDDALLAFSFYLDLTDHKQLDPLVESALGFLVENGGRKAMKRTFKTGLGSNSQHAH